MEDNELEAFTQWFSTVEQCDVPRIDRTKTQMWLLKAAWSGHHDVVDALLEAHVSLEKDDFPHDALQAAIYCGQENVAMRLLRDIPNVNMTGGYFENALQAACLGGNHGLAMHLLEMGADANAWGRHGSPLKAACFRGHNEVVRLLIRYGATMNATNSKWNALEAAASRGHLLTCHILVETYPRVVAQKESRGSSIQSVFETALYMAALEGYSEIVEYLLKSGAGSFLPRALEAALRGCNAEVLRVLLAQIPKLENYTRYQTNKGTHTPPDAWVTVDFESLLNARNNLEDEWKAKESADGLQKERYEFFISRVPEASWWQQIRANRLDFCQALGMHRPQGMQYLRALAAYRCTRAQFEAFISKGLDLKGHSASAIEVAAKGGNLDALDYLLDRGNDLDGALQIAVLCKKPQAVTLILQKRPDVNSDIVAHVDEKSNSYKRIRDASALALAVEQRDEEMIALLLEHKTKSPHPGPGEGLLEAVRRSDYVLAELVLDAVVRPCVQPWDEDALRVASSVIKISLYQGNTAFLQRMIDVAEIASHVTTRFLRAFVHGALSPSSSFEHQKRPGWQSRSRRRTQSALEAQNVLSPFQRQKKLGDVLQLLQHVLTEADREEVACSVLSTVIHELDDITENLELLEDYMAPYVSSCLFADAVRQAFESLLKQLRCNSAMEILDRYSEYHSILTESHILQAVLQYTPAGCCSPFSGLCGRHTKDLSKTLRTVIRAGAQINGKDDEGHSPLYYACLMGWETAFTLLIEAGADIQVLQTRKIRDIEDEAHTTRSSIDVHNDSSPSSQELEIADLLQVTLRGFLRHDSIYNSKERHKQWSTIIFHFLDARIPCNLDDPALSSLLESACRHGLHDEVERLLNPDLWTHVTSVSAERHFLFRSHSLHIAVRSGEMKLSSILLKHQVDPRSKKIDEGGNKEVTPIEACLSTSNRKEGWEAACDMLIDCGVSEEDAEGFLYHAIRANQPARIRRLLDKRTRVPKLYGLVTPETLVSLMGPKDRPLINFDGMVKELSGWIQYVEHYDTAIERIQIVQRLNLTLPPIGGLVTGIMQNRQIAEDSQVLLLDYVMKLYEHDVNAPFPCKCGKSVTLLYEALFNSRAEVFEALLDRGADANDPALPYPAFTLLCRDGRFRGCPLEDVAIKMASSLLARGADVNGINARNDTNQETLEHTLLMYSIGARHTKMASWLIEHGVDVNKGFVAPLSLAFRVDFPQREVIQLLLESGATSRQHDLTKEYLLDPAIGLGPDNYWGQKYCFDCGLHKVYGL